MTLKESSKELYQKINSYGEYYGSVGYSEEHLIVYITCDNDEMIPVILKSLKDKNIFQNKDGEMMYREHVVKLHVLGSIKTVMITGGRECYKV